jgi:hypothetical protein
MKIGMMSIHQFSGLISTTWTGLKGPS